MAFKIIFNPFTGKLQYVPVAQGVNWADILGGPSSSPSQIDTGISEAGTSLQPSVIDTDGTLTADSDSKVASQKATKTYIDNAVSSISLTPWTSDIDGAAHHLYNIHGISNPANSSVILDTTSGGFNSSASVAIGDPNIDPTVYVSSVLSVGDPTSGGYLKLTFKSVRVFGGGTQIRGDNFILAGADGTGTFSVGFIDWATQSLTLIDTSGSINSAAGISFDASNSVYLNQQSSAPGSPSLGAMYFDTTLNQVGVYNGTTWDYTIPLSYLDIDGTLAADSDTHIATQKAVKTYVDTIFASVSTSVDWTGHLLKRTGGSTAVDWNNELMFDPSSIKSIDWQNRQLWDSAVFPSTTISIDWGLRQLIGSNGGTRIDYQNDLISDSAGNPSIDWDAKHLINGGQNLLDWNNGILSDISGTASLFWGNFRQLIASDGTTIMLDWSVIGTLDAKTNRIINVVNPVSAQDVATKNYTDTGLSTKQNTLGYTPAHQASSPTNGDIAQVDASGNPLDSGKVFSTDTTLAGNSDNNISTQKATKTYIDTSITNAIAGVNPAVAVQAATTQASDTSGLTYTHVAGIGDFFTGTTNTPITIDGFTFTTLGQRLLVKNDTQSPSGAFNGIYYVTQVQTSLLPPILTRALDYDQSSDINNTGAIPVINGTVNATTQWVITSTVNTVGTDPLTFVKFSLAPSTIVTLTDVQTLTNKRITRRVNTVASSATPSINSDTTDLFTITALATAVTSFTTNLTGTPVNGDLLEIRILDNGSPQGLTWGASFTSTGGTTLPTTTVASTTLRILVEWNSASSKWECIGTT